MVVAPGQVSNFFDFITAGEKLIEDHELIQKFVNSATFMSHGKIDYVL